MATCWSIFRRRRRCRRASTGRSRRASRSWSGRPASTICGRARSPKPRSRSRCFARANTSLGVALLADLVERAARVLGTDWDIEIVETHHRHKADAPSGTALMLGEAAARGRGSDARAGARPRRHRARRARPGAIGFASLRGGTVAGDHDVLFLGPEERADPVASRREPDDLRPRRARRRALPRRQAGRPLFDAGRHRRAVKREQVFEFFRRLAEANPSPTTELEYEQSLSRCWSRSCCRRRRPTSASTSRRAPLFAADQTPQQMVDLGEEALRDAIKTIGLFNTKAKNVIALSQALIDEHRRRGAAHPRRACRRCPASAARPPMSCSTPLSARRPSPSTPMSSASATAPASRRARRRRGRSEARENRARSPSAATRITG